jgi:hypothetical protein
MNATIAPLKLGELAEQGSDRGEFLKARRV